MEKRTEKKAPAGRNSPVATEIGKPSTKSICDWFDPIYVSTILAFNTEAHLNQWQIKNETDKGFTIPMGVCNELSARWYSGTNNKQWRRPDVKETQSLFSSLGLIGDFWNLQ
jgi:hypothetical protein